MGPELLCELNQISIVDLRRRFYTRHGTDRCLCPSYAKGEILWINPPRKIYPAGIYHVIKRVATLGKPIYITENGLPDAEDERRPRFLVTHLARIQQAIAEGADVRGYYHWSFTDNFEWAEGWALRFGLVALDHKTQVRSPRPSAELYSQIIRENAITWDMAQTHARESLADLFR